MASELPSIAHPYSWRDDFGVIHTGEKCIRLDHTSDWPWTDCGASSAYMRWINQPPTCLWCVVGVDRESGAPADMVEWEQRP